MTVGGELLGNGLRGIVSRFGVSPTLLGNTAIAALTEAEEIGRVAVPACRGRPDMAVANIGGTAIHFLTLNAGILAVVLPCTSTTRPCISISRPRSWRRRSTA